MASKKRSAPAAGRPAPSPWWVTNPGYRRDPPRVFRLNGKVVVEMDGGTMVDADALGKKPSR